MGAEFNFTELKVKTEKAAIKAGREVISKRSTITVTPATLDRSLRRMGWKS